jgi:hypothetical protein
MSHFEYYAAPKVDVPRSLVLNGPNTFLESIHFCFLPGDRLYLGQLGNQETVKRKPS